MTSTGKAARRAGGNRYACKRMKTRRKTQRSWGKLPVSAARGNAQAFNTGGAQAPEVAA